MAVLASAAATLLHEGVGHGLTAWLRGDIPTEHVTSHLNHVRYVSQWSGIYTSDLYLDGQNVPVLGENADAAVAPPVLSGHGLEAADQMVLGAVTLWRVAVAPAPPNNKILGVLLAVVMIGLGAARLVQYARYRQSGGS